MKYQLNTAENFQDTVVAYDILLTALYFDINLLKIKTKPIHNLTETPVDKKEKKINRFRIATKFL